jgi:hypothetical protein
MRSSMPPVAPEIISNSANSQVVQHAKSPDTLITPFAPSSWSLLEIAMFTVDIRPLRASL